ncbi:hypothetical protein [Kitasatospora sp. GAS1066B]|uniref:hypothetical protein n=1 Tax=Kitasatospora sp. GAS1066B TaxID=3156271 RepID=UPI0035147944
MPRGANITVQITVLIAAFALRSLAIGWLFLFAVVFTLGLGALIVALPLLAATLVPVPHGRVRAPLLALFLTSDAFLLTFALLLPDAGDSYSYAPLSVLTGQRELSPNKATLFTELGEAALLGYLATTLATLVIAVRQRPLGQAPSGPWPPTRSKRFG